MSEFERTLRGLHADGKIDLATLKALLAAHGKDLENNHAPLRSSSFDPVGSDPIQSGG